MNILQIFQIGLIAVHVIVCLLLVLIVLMQRPRNEGLGAAFGGGMTDSLFGAQTTNILSKFTVGLGIFFFLITLALSSVTAKMATTESPIQKNLIDSPAPPEKPVTQAGPTPEDASDAANPFAGGLPLNAPMAAPSATPLLSDPAASPSPLATP